ncbi:hypothetical protein KA977_00845 [Candidatus Dependentiae bacterium]|nr:hypothetical protein [Candidatus Dependentiae bacterium]
MFGNWGSYSSIDTFIITSADNQPPVITVNDDSYTIKSEGVNYIGKSFDADFSDNTGIDTVYINLNANTEVLHSGGVTSITENWNMPVSIYNSLTRNSNNRINLTVIDNAGNSSNSYINIRCETMSLDGVSSDWQSDEVIDTDLTEGDNVVFYFSWDDTSFYAGIDNVELYSGVDNKQVIWFGFDSTFNGSGGDSFTNPGDQAGRTRFTGSFKPEYCIRIRNNIGNEWEHSLIRWTGTEWSWTNLSDTVRTYLSWDASHKFTEIIIPRSIFGTDFEPSDRLGLCMWIVDPTGDGANGWTWATLPVSNTEGASALQSDSIYFSSLYDTIPPLSPNIAPVVYIDTPVNCETSGIVRFKWTFSDSNASNAQQYVNIEYSTTSIFTSPLASYAAATSSTNYDTDLGNIRGGVYWRVRVSDGRDWSNWTSGNDSFTMTASANGNVEWSGLKHDTLVQVTVQSYNYLYAASVMTNQACTVTVRSYKNDLTGVVCRVWWGAEYKYNLTKQFSFGDYDYWSTALPGRSDTGNLYYRFECGDGGNTVYLSGRTLGGFVGNAVNYGNWVVADNENNLDDFKYEVTSLPKVTVVNPVSENNGYDTSSSSVTLTGTNTNGCTVYLYLNGVQVSSDTDGNTAWSLSVNNLIANNTNTISVLQYNSSTSTYSETSKIYVFSDTMGPMPSSVNIMDMVDSTPAIDFSDFTDSFGISLYEILIDTNSGFSNADTYYSTVSALTIPDTGYLSQDTWYIKIRGKDVFGNWGSYSSVDTFIITSADNQPPVITVNDDSYTIKSISSSVYGKLIDIDFTDNTGIETVYLSNGTNTESVLSSIGTTYTANWEIGSSIFQYLQRGNNKLFVTAIDNYSNYSSAAINVAVETIYVNGSVTDFQTDELLETRLNNSFYVAWDDTSLYLAYSGTDVDLGTADLFVYLQVSTSSQNDSSRTTINWGGGGTHTLPFGANYVLCAEDGDWVNDRFQKNINGTWQAAGNSVNAEIYGGWAGNKVTEFRINWSSIGGKPSWMKVTAIHQYDGSSNIYNSYPSGNPASGLTNVTLTDYYYFENFADTVSPQTGKMINAVHIQNQNVSGYNDGTKPYIYPYPAISYSDYVSLRLITNKQSGGNITAYYTTDGTFPTTSSSNISFVWEGDTGLVNSDVWIGYMTPKVSGLTIKYIFKIVQDSKPATYLGLNGRKTSELDVIPFSYYIQTQDTPTIVSPVNNNETSYVSVSNLVITGVNKTGDSVYILLNETLVNKDSDGNDTWSYILNLSVKNNTVKVGNGVNTGVIYVVYDTNVPMIILNDSYYVMKSNSVKINVDFSDTSSLIKKIKYRIGSNWFTVFEGASSSYTADWFITQGYESLSDNSENFIEIRCENYAGNYVSNYITVKKEAITVDGSLSDWQTDELIETRNSKGFYLTWDDTSLYLGYSNTELTSDAGGADVFVYFSTSNPVPSATNSTIDWSGYGTHILPVKSQFVLCFENGTMANGGFEFHAFNGTVWQAQAYLNMELYGGWSGNSNTEYRIGWDQFYGKPDTMAVVVIHQWETGKNIFNSFPKQNPAPNTDNSVTLTNYYYYPNLSDTISPDYAKHYKYDVSVSPSFFQTNETFTVSYSSKDGFNRLINNVTDSINITLTPYVQLSKSIGSITNSNTGSIQTYILSGEPGYYKAAVRSLSDNNIFGETEVRIGGEVFNVSTTGKTSGSGYDTYIWNLTLNCEATSGLDSCFLLIDTTVIQGNANYLFQNSNDTILNVQFNFTADSWNNIADAPIQHYIIFHVYNDSGILKTLTYTFYKGISKPYIIVNDDSYVFHSSQADMGNIINIDFYDTSSKITDAWITNETGTDTKYIFANVSYPYYSTNWQIPSGFTFVTGNNKIFVYIKNENGMISDAGTFYIYYDEINILSGNLSEFSENNLVEYNSTNTHKLYVDWDNSYFYFGFKGVDMSTDSIFIIFDNTPGSASGANCLLTPYYNLRFNGAFLPEAAVSFRGINRKLLLDKVDANYNLSGAINIDTCLYYAGTTESLLRIPKTIILSSSNQVNIGMAVIFNNGTSSYVWRAFPATNSIGDLSVSSPLTITDFYVFNELTDTAVFNSSNDLLLAQVSSELISTSPEKIKFTAKNGKGEILTGYNGTLSLSSSNGSVNPTTITLSKGEYTATLYFTSSGNLTLTYSEPRQSGFNSIDSTIALTITQSFDPSGKTSWANDAIIYNVLVPQFVDGEKTNNTMGQTGGISSAGGDLQGIIKKIKENYFQNLGVNCLYLSPIYPCNEPDTTLPDNSGWLGFDPVDLFDVRKGVGGWTAMSELIEVAHKNNIKIMLDHPAYWSWNHPLFKNIDGSYNDYYINRGWFDIHWFGSQYYNNYESFGLLPVNHQNGELNAYLLEQAKYWSDKGLDGMRFDVATFFGERDADQFDPPGFWGWFNTELKKHNPEFLTIGEIILWNDGPWESRWYLAKGRLDGAFAHTLTDLQGSNEKENQGAIKRYFMRKWTNGTDFLYGNRVNVGNSQYLFGAKTLEDACVTNYTYSGTEFGGAKMVYWLTNHDRSRFLTDCFSINSDAVGAFRGAMTFGWAWTQIPMVYNGDEIGMYGTASGRPNYDDGGQRASYENFLNNYYTESIGGNINKMYKLMGFLRRYYKSLRTGSIEYLYNGEYSEPMAFVRKGNAGETNVLYVWNNNASEQKTINIPVGSFAANGDIFQNVFLTNDASYVDTSSYTVSAGILNLTLQPHQAMILIHKGHNKIISDASFRIKRGDLGFSEAYVQIKSPSCDTFYMMTDVNGYVKFSYFFEDTYTIAVIKDSYNTTYFNIYMRQGDTPVLEDSVFSNSKPNKPALISPVSNQTIDYNNYTLQWTFSDPDAGDRQKQIMIQIDTNIAMSSVIFETTIIMNAYQYSTPFILQDDETYCWRIKVWDSFDSSSEWSDSGIFYVRQFVASINLDGKFVWGEWPANSVLPAYGLIKPDDFRILWDANYIYFGMNKGTVFDNDSVYIFIDTDYYTTNNGINLAASINGIQHNLPFNSDYVLIYNTNSSANAVNLKRWESGSWVTSNFTGSGARYVSGGGVEIRLPRTDLGNPSRMRILFTAVNGTTNWLWGVSPNSNNITYSDAGGITSINLTSYFEYNDVNSILEWNNKIYTKNTENIALSVDTIALPFTPTIDATKDPGWGDSPLIDGTNAGKLPGSLTADDGKVLTEGLCRDVYITNDVNNLYIGWEAVGDHYDKDVDGSEKSANYGFILFTDTYPDGISHDPWGSDNSEGKRTTRVIHYSPDYWITGWISYANNDFGGFYLYGKNGTNWSAGTGLVNGIDYKVSVNGNWGEIKIPLTSLGINVGDKVGVIYYGRHQEKNYGINDIGPYYYDGTAGYPVSDWAGTLSVIDATKAKFYRVQEHTMTTVTHIPSQEPVSGQGLMRQPSVIYSNNNITLILKTINIGSGTPVKLIYSADNWNSQNSLTMVLSYTSGNEKYYQAVIPYFNRLCNVNYYFEIESSIKNYIYGTDTLSYSTTSLNTAKTNAFKFSIINSLPSNPVISISPELPKNSDNIIAAGYGSEDIDSDLLTYIFEWYKNNSLILTETDLIPPYQSVISSDSTNENDVWYCKLSVMDSNSGYSNSIISSAIKITDRWKIDPPVLINSAVLSDSEWIWLDKTNDERTIISQSSNFDINELRLKIDSIKFYFRMSLRDITNNNYPNVSICFDTDLISGNGNSVIGDDGRTYIGNKYVNYKPYWEKQLIIHNYEYDSPVVEWTDGINCGILNTLELSIDTVSNIIEFSADRTELGFTGSGNIIISVALFKNQLGLASEINSTVDLVGIDAIDNISIAGLGNNNNDKYNNYSSYQEDLEDGTADFWVKLPYNSSGFLNNTQPSIPAALSPQQDSIVQIFNAIEFKWNSGTDIDPGDTVTSYLFELSTDTYFNMNSVLYSVNLKSDSLTYILPESLNSLTHYYYRLRSRDCRGTLSDSLIIHFQTAGVPSITVGKPLDINNIDHYSRSQGEQVVEKNINFSWAPAYHSGGWKIKNYVIEISNSENFNLSNIIIADTIYGNDYGCTTYYTIKSSDYYKLTRGKSYFARIKAGDTDTPQNWSNWSVPSDGIYLTLKQIDGNMNDWSSDTSGVWGKNKSYYIGDTYYEAVWSDSTSDQRTDKSPQYEYLDMQELHIAADKYNMYFKLKLTGWSDDHQKYLQIPVSINDNSSNRYFIGRNVSSEDVMTSQAAAWNYLISAVTNTDNGYVKVLNTEYSQIGLGVLKKNVSDKSIEFSVPLEYIGGINSITSASAKFTPVLFWGNNDAVGQWNAGTPNAVDSVDNQPLCWWEVGNQVVEYYLNVRFDSENFVSSISGETTVYTSRPPSGSGYPPFSARSYIFYNVFVDRFWDGYGNNKPMDSSMSGGDFDGLIQKLEYFNEHAITGLYMSPIFDFGGGAWGYNQHDLYKVQGSFVRENWNKFKGWDDYVRLIKEARRRNIRVGIDWVPGQIYGNETSGGTIQKNPKMYFGDRFGGRRILQYLANVRQFYVDHAHHLWGLGTDFFRVDNPKFYPDPLVQGLPFFVYTRNYCDKFAPDLYTFGEVPGDAGECAAFCADGTRLHGMLDFPFAYPTKSWAGGNTSSTNYKSTLEGLASTYGRALMTGFYNNHDHSRTYHDIGGDWTGAYYKSDYAPGNMQTLMMLLAAHVGPPVIFYGDERVMSGGKEVTYPGFASTGSTGEMGVTRQFPWWEYDWYKYKNNPGATGAIDGSVKMAMMAREIMWWMHYDYSSRALYDNDGALIYTRTGDGREVICIINNSDGDKWVHSVPHSGTYYRDWFSLNEYTPGTGNFDVLVPSNYARFLVKDGFSLATLSVNIKDQNGNAIDNAIVSVGNKSCWTRSSGSTGACSIDRIFIEGWEGFHEYNVKVFKQGYKIYNVAWKFYPWLTASGDIILERDDGIPPSPPVGLRGLARGKGAELYWSANTESDFESYYIYRSTTSVPPNKTDFVFETLNPTYMDSNLDDGLNSGDTYYYWVRARDINDNISEPSNMVTVVPHKVKVTFQVDMSSSGLANIENVYIKSNTFELGRNDFNESYKMPDIDPLSELTYVGNGIYEITSEFDPTMTINYLFICKYDGGKWFDEYSFRTFTFENARELKIIDSPDWTQKVVKKWMVSGDVAPQAPINLSAVGKNNSVKLGWSLNKEADVDHYEIWKSVDGTNYYWVTNANKNIINYIDNNVSNGLTYYYKLKAVDKSDNISDYSLSVSVIPTESTDNIAPLKPKNIRAQGNGLGKVLLSWDYNSEGDFAGYNVYRDTVPNFILSQNKKINSVLITPSFFPVYEDVTAVPGIRYYYRITALDDVLNESEGSDSITVKLARLTFKMDIGTINPVNVQYISNIPFIGWNPGVQMTFDTSTTYKFITDLVVGEQILYKYGYNTRSLSERDFITVSKNRELTVPDVLEKIYNDDWQEQPQKVEGFTVLPGNKSAYLYWNKNTSDQDLLGYNVYLQNADGSDSKVNSTVITTAFYKIENLNNGTKYFYFVRPVDSGDLKLEGVNSDVKEVTPRNTVPVIFKN